MEFLGSGEEMAGVGLESKDPLSQPSRISSWTQRNHLSDCRVAVLEWVCRVASQAGKVLAQG